MRRLAATVAGVWVLLLGTALPALAQYPPGGEEAAVSDTTLAQGEPLTITGEGFTPGSTVTASLDEQPLGSTTVDTQGTFRLEVTIPQDAPCGANTIDIVSDAGDAASQAIMIECPDGSGRGDDDVSRGSPRHGGGSAPGAGERPARPGAVARTGVNVTVGMALALALLVVGGGALVSAAWKARRVR